MNHVLVFFGGGEAIGDFGGSDWSFFFFNYDLKEGPRGKDRKKYSSLLFQKAGKSLIAFETSWVVSHGRKDVLREWSVEGRKWKELHFWRPNRWKIGNKGSLIRELGRKGCKFSSFVHVCRWKVRKNSVFRSSTWAVWSLPVWFWQKFDLSFGVSSHYFHLRILLSIFDTQAFHDSIDR